MYSSLSFLLYHSLILITLLLSPIISTSDPIRFLSDEQGQRHNNNNEINFFHSYGNIPLIKGCFGVPSQCFKLKLSSNYNQNWLIGGVNDNKFYDKTKSQSYLSTDRSVPIQDKNNSVYGISCIDQFSFGEFKLNQVEFALIEQVDVFEYTGVISFAYLHEDNEYSLLDSLYKTNQIQSKVFYITYLNALDGKFTVGVYPKERSLSNRQYHYKRCTLFQTKTNGKLNSRWECQLNAIYYEGHNKEMQFIRTPNERISFNLSSNLLALPRAVFDQFVSNYFGELLGQDDDHWCSMSKNGIFTQITCLNGFDYNKLGNVSYIIGKWSIVFKPRDLFIHKKNEEVKFAIVKHDTLDKYIFGNPLFKKYSTVFDKEMNEMGIFLDRDRQ